MNLDGTRVFDERENIYTCFRAFKNDSTPLRDSKSFLEALVSVECPSIKFMIFCTI